MSKAYIRAVRDNLPSAVHVFDHFHVIKLFNDKLSAFRRELYHEASTDWDRRILKGTRWLRARASSIRMLLQFADTLAEHQEGILAYYDYPISTGPLEGTNTKIQAMKRQAYGFRDRAFFKLKILSIHESKYALVG